MICVDASRVSAAQPDKVLFADVSLTVSRGDRVALVGVNGSGKSTLLRILSGRQAPDAGDVRFGRGVRITVLEQDPVLPGGTVGEFLDSSQSGESWEVAAVATSLGVMPLLDRRTDELSGGQAKRVALAAALVGEADVIVLDEPTNHLDLEAIEWLERRLSASTAALLFVTHDRHLMDRLTTSRGAGRVFELDRGEGHAYRAEAGSSAYAASLDGRAERDARSEAEEATRRILARRELAWLRRGAPARSSKPKARLRAANEIVDGGPTGRDLRDTGLDLDLGTTRLGNQVVELRAVARRFGDTTIFEGVDLLVEPGARLGVVGPNGAGKSTLLDIIAGRAEPTEGEVRTGSTVVVGYADQRTTALDPDAVVRELVAGPYRQPDWEDRALLERFWFDSTAQYAPVRMLSGGERRRLQLVMVLAGRPNLLVLDEPTNDLDLDTLRALEGFLDEWPGALVVASHDRAFLDRTIDHVLAIEPGESAGGRVVRVPGGVAGWLAGRSVPDGRSRRDASSARSSATSTASTGRSVSRSTLTRRLRESEQAMTKLQRVIGELTDRLAATTDHEELARIGADLAAAQLDLTGHEERWLEIADQLG